jgi:hypothetical protein
MVIIWQVNEVFKMANRRTYQFQGSNIAGIVRINAKVTFGASGAPTLASTNNSFISSITRNSAGDYTIALADAYNGLLGVRHVFNSGSSAPASPALWVKTDAVTTKSLRIVFNLAGTATDPASGEIVLLEIVLKNTSI